MRISLRLHWSQPRISGFLCRSSCTVSSDIPREINQRRQRTGELWQSETIDRIIRDSAEFDEKANYTLQNAVKAGLAEDGWQYDGFWCEDSIS
jgi:hypothetical protein